MSDPESERRARALQRGSYPGGVVRAGEPKPALYANLDAMGRLAQMTVLCRDQWLAAGGAIDTRPRASWPGEIVRLRHD